MTGPEFLFNAMIKAAGIEPKVFIDQFAQFLQTAKSIDDRLRRIEAKLNTLHPDGDFPAETSNIVINGEIEYNGNRS